MKCFSCIGFGLVAVTMASSIASQSTSTTITVVTHITTALPVSQIPDGQIQAPAVSAPAAAPAPTTVVAPSCEGTITTTVTVCPTIVFPSAIPIQVSAGVPFVALPTAIPIPILPTAGLPGTEVSVPSVISVPTIPVPVTSGGVKYTTYMILTSATASAPSSSPSASSAPSSESSAPASSAGGVPSGSPAPVPSKPSAAPLASVTLPAIAEAGHTSKVAYGLLTLGFLAALI